MRSDWARIETWLKKHSPATPRALRPGAPEARIAKAENALGITFPADVRASYRIHDGQSSDGPVLFNGWALLSLARVMEEWRLWKGLLDGGEFKRKKSKSNGATLKDWWHPAWIPLSGNGAGDHHCLDLAPGPKGTRGQIIRLFHDDADRPVITESFDEWLKGFADELDLKTQVPGRTGTKAVGAPTMDELIGMIGESASSAGVLHVLARQRLDREVEEDGISGSTGSLSDKQHGFEIQLGKKGRIQAIHLFIVPAQGYAAFAGALSEGLRPGDGVNAVRRRLGKPTRSGPDAGWDRFDSERVCIRFGYREEETGIRLITLMAPDVAP